MVIEFGVGMVGEVDVGVEMDLWVIYRVHCLLEAGPSIYT